MPQNTEKSIAGSPDIQKKISEGIKPGSFLASIRPPVASFIWTAIEEVGLGKNKALYDLFYRHVNPK